MNLHSHSDAQGRSADADRPEAEGPRARGILALCAALAAVSGAVAFLAIGEGGVSTAAGAERLEVSFDEWDLKTDKLELEEGRVTFAVTNDGEVDHELLVLRTDSAADDLPQGISGPVPELAGKLIVGSPHQHISTNDSYALINRKPDANTKDHIKPGDEIAVDEKLKPGNYVLYCNLPGHYQRGQYASLKVTKKSNPLEQS